ncbi:phosphotransferase [Actinocatenispora rupis]|uniref:Aminoglycoside phosphotransferase domain-containing protein n=1 Tax=Actinocatenispora rupis TaxID=519421 RepID=A0A8J3NBI7_9ACTN|nr:phosphotransferase [Actinocatenispora rupis]GID10835.1 hypothetical protein Aru02nite_17240 [Actinocatenispora rupis]
MDVPGTVAAAAARFGVPAGELRVLPGATGDTWSAGPHVLRMVRPGRVAAELAAHTAAARVVPVPEVLDRYETAGSAALLLRRLPGVPAGDRTGLDPAAARRRGLACGRVHHLLSAVPAPPELPPAVAAPYAGDRLLHLDLHPFNVLVDEGAAVTGVLDWANAAAGHPDLDRARTAAILAGDPTARALAADPVAAALFAGWAEAAGFAALGPEARRWARDHLLADLAHRYSPAELADTAAALDAPPS